MNHQREGFSVMESGYGPLVDGQNAKMNKHFLEFVKPYMVCNIIQ